MPVLGCIADDVTGATDLAGALTERGVRTVLTLGQPRGDLDEAVDAVVIALKIRTLPATQARAEVRAGRQWLQRHGIERVYSKYCSTFDSTPEGNIGPVADELRAPGRLVVHCPAYPANARTVHQGRLFVGADLLSESSLRSHPLTPMTDANLVRVLQAQTPEPVGLLDAGVVRRGVDAVAARLEALAAAGMTHAIADATTDEDIDVLAAAVAYLPVLAGGAPFGAAIAAVDRHGTPAAPPPLPAGRCVVLAGSASAATQRQIAAFSEHGPVRLLSVAALAAGPAAVEAARDWVGQQPGRVLIGVDASARAVADAQAEFGVDQAAAIVEQAIAELAVALVGSGVRRLVVAGGETSGAVATALGVDRVLVGPSIATGVPWTVTQDGTLALAFKSGNFGDDDFFVTATGTGAGTGMATATGTGAP